MATKMFTQKTPDVTVNVSVPEVLSTIFGTYDNRLSFAETISSLEKLTVDELSAARAYLGEREATFKEINAKIDELLKSIDTSKFPNENTLISVYDTGTKKVIGGVSVETKVETTRSTKSKKNAEEVKKELAAAGLSAEYTRTSVELKNDALFEAKANNKLPASVANLLSETQQSKRSVSFLPTESLNLEE